MECIPFLDAEIGERRSRFLKTRGIDRQVKMHMHSTGVATSIYGMDGQEDIGIKIYVCIRSIYTIALLCIPPTYYFPIIVNLIHSFIHSL